MKRRTITKAIAAGCGYGLASGIAAAQEDEREIRIENTRDRNNFVQVWVSGEVLDSSDTGSDDDIGEGYFESVLPDLDSWDEFTFTGDIECFRWSAAEPNVILDGEALDLEFVETRECGREEKLLHVSNTTDERNEVTVTVSGDVRRFRGTEDEDDEDDDTVTAVLADESAWDEFAYTGEVEETEWTGERPVIVADQLRIDTP
jgi:hypothetical protein